VRAHGRRVSLYDAVARYALGSLVNALAPARAGTLARLGLFTRAVGGKATAATAASVGGTRVVLLGALGVVGLGPSMLPFPPAVGAAAGTIAIAVAIAGRRRLGCMQVAPWVGVSTLLRLVAAGTVAFGFGVDHPAGAACAMLAAMGLAGTLPLTPGNAGVGAAAVAFALAGKGVPGNVGLAAGVAYGLVETAVAVTVGLLGAVVLAIGRWPSETSRSDGPEAVAAAVAVRATLATAGAATTP
jgi:hypothetical protein